MSKKSWRQEFRKKSCDGKVKHKSMLSAEFILNQMKPDPKLNIYKCIFCQSYHIGNSTPLKQEEDADTKEE